MQRIRDLDRYQKAVILIVAFLAVLFAVIYANTISKTGFLYKDEILIPSTQDGNTVYTGTVSGGECIITVTPDKTVTMRCGSSIYGPYTAKEDPSAIPAEYSGAENCIGIELRENQKLLFRGAVLTRQQNGFRLINENGEMYGFSAVVTMSDGTQWDWDGNALDPWELDVYSVLELMGQPELTHKGDWGVWFMGLCLCVMTVVSVLFADELFRLSLVFRVQDPYRADPSDWEISSRYISWTIMPVLILILFITGLK